MARGRDEAIRADLLARATDYVLARGLSDLSLRPLAEAIGTSARMLVHHFGGKERLVSEILASVEARFVAEMPPRGTADPLAVLEAMWARMADPATEPLQRTSFEVWGLALVRPEAYGAYLGSVVAPWTAALADGFRDAGLPPERADALAALAVASFQGLALHRLTSGDAEVPDRAFHALLAWLRAALAEGGSHEPQ